MYACVYPHDFHWCGCGCTCDCVIVWVYIHVHVAVRALMCLFYIDGLVSHSCSQL